MDEQTERLYEAQIRPVLLDPIQQASAQPVAVFVAGQPGAGKAVALQRLRRDARFAEAAPLLVSPEELRAFDPSWRSGGRAPTAATQAPQSTSEQWSERLVRDAANRRANLLIEASQRSASLLALAGELKAQGYEIEVMVVTADGDASRLASVTAFERLASRGAAAGFVSRKSHDQAFDALRDTLARIERDKAVDRLRLSTRDGRSLFENARQEGDWRHSASAVAALDAYRERELTAREKADNALRWHTLVARLQARTGELPREIIDQAVAWRTQSTERALADPQSRTLYEAGLAAETFRTLPGQHFVREFPQYRAAANKLDKARDYAAQQFADSMERERFVAIARERIAEQIEQGRPYARSRGKEEGRAR